MGSLLSKLKRAPEPDVIRGPYDLKSPTTLPPCGGRLWQCASLRGGLTLGPCILTRCGTKTGMCICYECWTTYRVHSLSNYPPGSPRYEWPNKHIKWPELPGGLYMHF